MMAGTILVALQTYAGVDVRDGKLNINPHLPRHWRGIRFNLDLQGNHFAIKVSPNEVRVKYDGRDDKVVLWVNDEEKEICNGAMAKLIF